MFIKKNKGKTSSSKMSSYRMSITKNSMKLRSVLSMHNAQCSQQLDRAKDKNKPGEEIGLILGMSENVDW